MIVSEPRVDGCFIYGTHVGMLQICSRRSRWSGGGVADVCPGVDVVDDGVVGDGVGAAASAGVGGQQVKWELKEKERFRAIEYDNRFH
jgi:hypothetical protein